MVDAYEINSGFPLAFAYTFLLPNKSANAIVVLRHGAFPIALNHAMWQKYKIGESMKIIDPETKAKVEPAIVSGAQQAFRKVSLLAIVLVCVFGSIAVYDRLRGGYKPEELPAKEFTPAELASDF